MAFLVYTLRLNNLVLLSIRRDLVTHLYVLVDQDLTIPSVALIPAAEETVAWRKLCGLPDK